MTESAISVYSMAAHSEDISLPVESGRRKRKATIRRSATAVDQPQISSSSLNILPKPPPLAVIPMSVVPTGSIAILSPTPPLQSTAVSSKGPSFALIPLNPAAIPIVQTPNLRSKLRLLAPKGTLASAQAGMTTNPVQNQTPVQETTSSARASPRVPASDQSMFAADQNDLGQSATITNGQKGFSQPLDLSIRQPQRVLGPASKRLKPIRDEPNTRKKPKCSKDVAQNYGADGMTSSTLSAGGQSSTKTVSLSLRERIRVLEQRIEEMVVFYETRIKELETEVARLEAELKAKFGESDLGNENSNLE